jgi:hypothetical protein
MSSPQTTCRLHCRLSERSRELFTERRSSINFRRTGWSCYITRERCKLYRPLNNSSGRIKEKRHDKSLTELLLRRSDSESVEHIYSVSRGTAIIARKGIVSGFDGCLVLDHCNKAGVKKLGKRRRKSDRRYDFRG